MQDLNMEQTQKVEKKVEYKRYVEWLKDNGVLMDNRVRYPSCFGKSKLIGVSASKNIEKGRAIVAIPYKLIITVNKVKETQPFGQIIKDNPDIFNSQDDRSFMILLLYVTSQLLKQQKSLYYPYFCIADGSMVSNWSHWDMMALENRELVSKIKQLKEQIELQFLAFLRVFRRYQNIFPAEITNSEYKKVFERAYGIITTRAFGWSLPSISIIPLADSFNHNHTYVNHYLVNVKLENDIDVPKSYIKYKGKANLSLIDEKLTPSLQELQRIRKPKIPKRLKFVQKHKQILKQQKVAPFNKRQQQVNQQLFILHQQYKAEVHNLRQLHFYQSSCSEDNDTDQQTIYERTFKEQSFNTEEKYSDRSINNKNKKSIVQNYWQLFVDDSFNDNNEDQSDKEQQQPNKPALKNQNKIQKDSQGSGIIQSQDSEEEDQLFDWVDKSSIQDIYFVMQTKQVVKENEQVYNFYGRRSNKFLLLGYNFTLSENHYDSFAFRFKFDIQMKSLQPQKLVYDGKFGKVSKQCRVSREIRIKSQRVNIELINHCRSFIILLQKQQYPNSKITIPFNIEIQIKVLKFANQVIQHLLKNYMTTVQQDQQLLEKSYGQYQAMMALRLKISHKKILEAQYQIIQKCIQFAKRWRKGKIDLQTKQMIWVKKAISYLKSLQRSKTI